jgi:hypothetical protein
VARTLRPLDGDQRCSRADRNRHRLVRRKTSAPAYAGQISGQRQAAVEHAASRIADIDDLERAVVHILLDPFQWRIPEHVTPDVWFEVGR